MRGTNAILHADPCVVLRARRRRVASIAAAAVLLAFVWAFGPLSHGTGVTEAPESRGSAGATSSAVSVPLDLAPFSATLWVEPAVAVVESPKAEPKAPPLPSAPPVRLQLLGIERVSASQGSLGDSSCERWRAMVYDPETDRLFMVSDGERVGVHEIASVEPSRLVLRVVETRFAPREDVLAINPTDAVDGTGSASQHGRSRTGTRGGGVP